MPLPLAFFGNTLDPERKVALQLAALVRVTPTPPEVAGPVDLVVDANVRNAPLEQEADASYTGAIPDTCVFVVGVGGFDDVPFADGGQGGSEERPQVQVTARGPRHDRDTARLLAVATWQAIDKRPPSGYFEARARGSAPAWVREDAEGRHEFGFTVELKRDNTA